MTKPPSLRAKASVLVTQRRRAKVLSAHLFFSCGTTMCPSNKQDVQDRMNYVGYQHQDQAVHYDSDSKLREEFS